MTTKFNEWFKERIYSESINHLPQDIQDFLLNEDPHVVQFRELPAELHFFKNQMADLGFENLDLSATDRKMIRAAFYGNGVKIPKTPYKLRYVGHVAYVVVELAEGNEPVLPDHWREGVKIVNRNNEITWIGKRVRPDQLPPDLDWETYKDVGEGWMLK